MSSLDHEYDLEAIVGVRSKESFERMPVLQARARLLAFVRVFVKEAKLLVKLGFPSWYLPEVDKAEKTDFL